MWSSIGINQSINQSINHSANIPTEARLSGATAKSVFNSKIEETVHCSCWCRVHDFYIQDTYCSHPWQLIRICQLADQQNQCWLLAMDQQAVVSSAGGDGCCLQLLPGREYICSQCLPPSYVCQGIIPSHGWDLLSWPHLDDLRVQCWLDVVAMLIAPLSWCHRVPDHQIEVLLVLVLLNKALSACSCQNSFGLLHHLVPLAGAYSFHAQLQHSIFCGILEFLNSHSSWYSMHAHKINVFLCCFLFATCILGQWQRVTWHVVCWVELSRLIHHLELILL